MAHDDPFACLDAELGRLWNEIQQARFPCYAPLRTGFQPSVDVLETSSEIVVRLDLAGAKPPNVRVTLLDRRLVVDGTRVEPAAAYGHDACYLRKEIPFGPFRAWIDLPQTVAVETARARFEDGFLVIRMPKPEPPPETQAPGSSRQQPRTVTITLHL